MIDQYSHIGRISNEHSTHIYLPPALLSTQSALEFATDAWNGVLSGTGAAFDVVTTDCGSGSDCIRVTAPENLADCGFTPTYSTDPATGIISGSMNLQLGSNWANYSTASIRRTYLHELGHVIGLTDYAAACSDSDAVMQANFGCGAEESPVTTLQFSDTLPVKKSVYGGGSRKACGF